MQRWGKRVLEGGDMYEQQHEFRNIIGGLTEDKVLDSLKNINCEVFELDGTLPIDANVDRIKEFLL